MTDSISMFAGANFSCSLHTRVGRRPSGTTIIILSMVLYYVDGPRRVPRQKYCRYSGSGGGPRELAAFNDRNTVEIPVAEEGYASQESKHALP